MMKPSGECSLERQRFWNEKEKRKRKGEEEEGEERRRRMEEGEEKIDKILESEQVQSTGQWQSPEQKVSNCRNSRSSWKKASTTRRGTRASTARGSVLGGISPTQPSENASAGPCSGKHASLANGSWESAEFYARKIFHAYGAAQAHSSVPLLWMGNPLPLPYPLLSWFINKIMYTAALTGEQNYSTGSGGGVGLIFYLSSNAVNP